MKLKIERETSACDWDMERIVAGTKAGERDWYCLEHGKFSGDNHPPYPYPFAKDLYEMRTSTKTGEWEFNPDKLQEFIKDKMSEAYRDGQDNARVHYYKRVARDAEAKVAREIMKQVERFPMSIRGEHWATLKALVYALSYEKRRIRVSRKSYESLCRFNAIRT